MNLTLLTIPGTQLDLFKFNFPLFGGLSFVC